MFRWRQVYGTALSDHLAQLCMNYAFCHKLMHELLLDYQAVYSVYLVLHCNYFYHLGPHTDIHSELQNHKIKPNIKNITCVIVALRVS